MDDRNFIVVGTQNKLFAAGAARISSALKFYPSLTFLLLVIATFFLVINFFLVNFEKSTSPTPTQKEAVIAKVDGEKIYQGEYEDAQTLIRVSQNLEDEKRLKKSALDYLVEKRVLAKEIKRQNLENLEEFGATFKERKENLIKFYNSEEKAIAVLGIGNPQNIDDYLKTVIYKNYFEKNNVYWKNVNFLTIHFAWDDPLPPEETAFKKIAEEKINELYQKVKEGSLTFLEAVKERCTDLKVNYRPLPGNRKAQIYKLQKEGEFETCLEQGLGKRITLEEPIWLDPGFLEKVKKIEKGQVSEVFTLKTDKGTDFAFIFIQVVDQGNSPFTTVNEFIDDLKGKSKIEVYEKI